MSWKERLGDARYRPNDHPRIWLFSGQSVQYPGETIRDAHYAPTDVTVALRRRPGAQDYADPNWYKWRNAPLSVPPLELEIAQPLPDLCTEHGRPAVSRLRVRSLFHDTRAHPRNPHGSNQLGRNRSPVSTIVAGEWPVCDRCTRRRQWYHGVAGVLVLVMGINLIAMLVVARVLEYKPLVVPLALGFFPGSLPIGSAIAVLLYGRGDNRVKVRPVDDERFLRIVAHPNFGAALHRMPPPPPAEQLPPPRYRIENGRVVPDYPTPDEQAGPQPHTRWGA